MVVELILALKAGEDISALPISRDLD